MGIPQPWDVAEVDARFRQGERVLQATKAMFFFTPNGPYTHECEFTREQLEALQHMSNEQLAAAILYPAARPSAPHEQTPSSVHQEGSTPRVYPVS